MAPAPPVERYRKGIFNTVLLLALLVSNTLEDSEWGGDGTPYGPLSFVLAALFLTANFHVSRKLAAVFSPPLMFLTLSVVFNLFSLPPAAYRSALGTAVAFALFTLKGPPLDEKLLRRSIRIYLIVCLGLSLYVTTDELALTLVRGNDNFNINPNGAAIFFFSCLALALVFTDGWLRITFALVFPLLIVTTGSRAGLLTSALLLVGYGVFATGLHRKPIWRNPFSARRFAWLLALALVPAIATVVVPEAVEAFQYRLERAGLSTAATRGGEGRDVRWERSIDASLESPAQFLLGGGPTSATAIAGGGTHSSYIESILSIGWPFTFFSVLAIAVLCLHHLRRGQRDFLLFAGVIALYGAVETVLLSGIGGIWFVLIFLSIYYQSVEQRVISSRAATAMGGA